MEMLPKIQAETPSPLPTPLVAGYIFGEPNYHTWRKHGTQDWLLMLTLSGTGRVGEVYAKAGDAVLIRPHAPHDYGTDPNAPHWELLWAHFLPRPHWHAYLSWPEALPTTGPEALPTTGGVGILPLSEQFETVTHLLQQSLIHTRGSQIRRLDFAMNALETALLWCDTQNPLSAQGKRDPRVMLAMDYLLSHLAAPVEMGELSRITNLSASHLSHLFKTQTGMTPQQFLEKERLFRAQQLLTHTSHKITQIALEVGYSSPFYFTTRFTKQMGISPRAYREQFLQSEPNKPSESF
jgi:AraC family transcriptional regulator, arabinose operon regulatory protein